jgi:hypothetical protein
VSAELLLAVIVTSFVVTVATNRMIDYFKNRRKW